MKLKRYYFFVVFSLLFVTGCTTNRVVYVNPPSQKHPVKPMTLALEYQDFKFAAMSLVKDMLNSGALNRPGGGRYVIAISRIINDTTQDIDTDQLLKDIRIALLKSGKAVITTYVRAGGPEDPMTREVRKLRGNDEFNSRTLPGKGQLIAPDLSLSGKIIQRVYYANGVKKVDYYFILTLTDVKTGLAFWEGEKVISKVSGINNYTW
jgi:uncharacterized protein (TIGR02722 family)